MIALHIITQLAWAAITLAILMHPNMSARELIQRARAFKALGLPRTAFRIALQALAHSRAKRASR